MSKIPYAVIVPPDAEPVTLADVKAHLRLIPGDDSEDKAILIPMITAAREYCENITGRALAPQTLAAYPAALRSVPLPAPPVQEIISVTAYLADGTAETLDPSAYYLDEISGALHVGAYPSGLRAVNPVEVKYTAGYAKLPMTLRQAMLLLIGHWYENRETVVVGAIASIEIQLTVATLLGQYKVWWF